MSAMLSVRDLEKTFGQVVAARDINVECAGGADRRHHRRQRRRQDHFRQHDHRPSDAVARATSSSRAGTSPGLPSRKIIAAWYFALVSGRAGISHLSPCSRTCAPRPRSPRARQHRRRVLRTARSPRDTVAAAEDALELFQIAPIPRLRWRQSLPQGVRKLLDIAMATAGNPRVCCCSTSRPAASAWRKSSG